MAMYTIGTLPLISRLTGLVKQCWYADDSAAGGKLSKLKQWWDLLSSVRPCYGYFPNVTKTILIVKETVLTDARTIIGDCGIQVTTEGHHYLGGVIGTPAFEQLFLRRKVDGWIDDLKTLSLFAQTQPHASYAAFIMVSLSDGTFFLCFFLFYRPFPSS